MANPVKSLIPGPLGDTFRKCMICGREAGDVTYFRMWVECDENDKPKPYAILLTCKGHDCYEVIDRHDWLYCGIPWSTGKPGHIILLCEDCPHRAGSTCNHPDLTANGGEGLSVYASTAPPAGVMVSYHTDDGLLASRQVPYPFTMCSGLPTDHPRYRAPQKRSKTP